ncbi:CotH protein [Anaeroplasma bactoclasticum]|uniref:CotH protein n=1 Tax=Anaeroplasma bactoclasticum TaxID=2088 RepID=A0A397S0Y2_9MOLU|nr:CotH protein [Anaeroplasma bactoclasticum]
MIEKIISYNVTALPNNSYYGHIEGNTNQILLENEESEEITAIPNLGYKFVSWSNGEKDETIRITPTEDTVLVANFEIDAYELPIMEIYTQDNAPIISKDEYVNCNVSVSNALYEYCFDSLSGKIKGRGNSTWNMAKKPYKLKFDKKIDLFGNGKAKTWTLIANYCDKSMIRNYIAYSMGKLLESDYVTSTQFIELFLNGEYLGVYLVCEQNEVGENRVEIDESYRDVNTGYLLELDRRAPDEGIEEGKDWFKLNSYPYAIKSPEPDDPLYTVEFTNYIKEYLNTSFNSILSKNYEDVKNYIDVDSFAKTYIVHEIMNMLDVSVSSFYI